MQCGKLQKCLWDHNFDAFRAQGCSAKSTFRTITRSEIHLSLTTMKFILRYKAKVFTPHGSDMTGAIVAVGLGKREFHHIQDALHHSDRALLGQTAPSHGLWLVWTSLLDNEDETE